MRDRAALVTPVITAETIAQMSGLADEVYVDPAVIGYVAELAEESRRQPHVKLGLSARGCLAFVRVAKTWAAADGRDHVVPDDIKALAEPVLCHRLLLDAEAQFSGVDRRHRHRPAARLGRAADGPGGLSRVTAWLDRLRRGARRPGGRQPAGVDAARARRVLLLVARRTDWLEPAVLAAACLLCCCSRCRSCSAAPRSASTSTSSRSGWPAGERVAAGLDRDPTPPTAGCCRPCSSSRSGDSVHRYAAPAPGRRCAPRGVLHGPHRAGAA